MAALFWQPRNFISNANPFGQKTRRAAAPRIDLFGLEVPGESSWRLSLCILETPPEANIGLTYAFPALRSLELARHP